MKNLDVRVCRLFKKIYNPIFHYFLELEIGIKLAPKCIFSFKKNRDNQMSSFKKHA